MYRGWIFLGRGAVWRQQISPRMVAYKIEPMTITMTKKPFSFGVFALMSPYPVVVSVVVMKYRAVTYCRDHTSSFSGSNHPGSSGSAVRSENQTAMQAIQCAVRTKIMSNCTSFSTLPILKRCKNLISRDRRNKRMHFKRDTSPSTSPPLFPVLVRSSLLSRVQSSKMVTTSGSVAAASIGNDCRK